MQKWQYLRDEVEDESAALDEKLGYWGEQGWELVSVCYIGTDLTYARTIEAPTPKPWKLFFKRP
jgi:hypothetical protein